MGGEDFPPLLPPPLGEGSVEGSVTISNFDSREHQIGQPMFKSGTDLSGRVLRKILTKRPFNPSIIQKFCARELLVENFRILRGFAKRLSFNWFDWI